MIYVISLGGSVIIKDKINIDFLTKFSKLIKKYSHRNKFVIVTGGGSTARKYMSSLTNFHLDRQKIGLIGIAVTQLNANLLKSIMKINSKINSIKDIRNLLKKQSIVITGAFKYLPNATSDGNCAQLAHYIKADLFINITNVKGLFDKDPRSHQNAKLLKKITYDKFNLLMHKIKFSYGQHFILDQTASKLIKKHKIKTIIIGEKLTNLEKVFRGKSFVGTTIN